MKDRELLNAELGRITPEEFRAEKMWLRGICTIPPAAEIHKTALGAEQSVPSTSQLL
ncbi:MAG: hypothetical protein IJV01_04500 [Bacteroidales bacterium]|nr:hypothetical protein [Bacteroidales bacterium]